MPVVISNGHTDNVNIRLHGIQFLQGRQTSLSMIPK